MRTKVYASILALFLVSLVAPWMTNANAGGSSASGTYKFVLEGEFIKQIEFDARGDERGAITGQVTYRDEAGVLELEDDVPGDPDKQPAEFYVTADLDSLTIENNRALMGGTVRDSSHRSYIGRCVQLVVEDNGDAKEVPDKLTWRFCQPEPGDWIPVDAEDPRDEGAWWRWWATDEELKDDKGIPSVNLIPGTRKGCPTFPLATYRFPTLQGEGQIQILQ